MLIAFLTFMILSRSEKQVNTYNDNCQSETIPGVAPSLSYSSVTCTSLSYASINIVGLGCNHSRLNQALSVCLTKVFGYYPDHQPTSDKAQDHFHVSPFVFNNRSVHLNITWENGFGSPEVEYIQICESGVYCNQSDLNKTLNGSVIFSTLEHPDFVYIIPGSFYTINIKFRNGTTVSENYTVPECIGTFCACDPQKKNLIKLLDVKYIEGHNYSVPYTSQNLSKEIGDYNITIPSYVRQDTNESFNVSLLRYHTNKVFTVRMDYLEDGEKYNLIIKYEDRNNTNPRCLYESYIPFTAKSKDKSEDKTEAKTSANYPVMKMVTISVILFFALILFCIIVKWTIFSKKTLMGEIKTYLFPAPPIIENLKKTSFSLPHQQINTLYSPLEMPADPYEFPRENIVIKDVVGQGAFGQVYYAKAYNLNGVPGFTMVAVKLLREGAPQEELADFQAEIRMLKKIGEHKNVVKFLACVTTSEPYMTIMELVANGDLKDYLLKLREIWRRNKNRRLFFPDDMEEKSLKINESNSESEDVTRFDADVQTPLLSDIGTPPEPVLDHRELEDFAFQIATGMAYLESIPVIHRDLAARNILITKEKVLKISDFGMSRSAPYVNRHLKKVPLRWMAIEAIEDFKTDSKSDVWSFGVVLWEIGTLGAFPYEDVPNSLILQALKSGVRLPRPEICTDGLYDLMQRCWMENPQNRPSFKDIVVDFKAKQQQVYVDFKRVNPNYVFPPTDPK